MKICIRSHDYNYSKFGIDWKPDKSNVFFIEVGTKTIYNWNFWLNRLSGTFINLKFDKQNRNWKKIFVIKFSSYAYYYWVKKKSTRDVPTWNGIGVLPLLNCQEKIIIIIKLTF